tara:strand:- start:87 stop:188 length:102 start_codon:yes stop_codon:yes gene_type:complete
MAKSRSLEDKEEIKRFNNLIEGHRKLLSAMGNL